MRPVEKRYQREFVAGMAAYVAVLFAGTWLLRYPLADASLWVRAGISLLPAVPIAFVARSLVRLIRDSDELQRRIDLEAIAIASLFITMGYFTLGLLAASDVIEVAGDVAMIWVLPLWCLAFGLAKCWSARRYR